MSSYPIEMATHSISAGDVVQLKSGGPEMTVEGQGGDDGYWICAWFSGTQLNKRAFHEASIERVDRNRLHAIAAV